MWQLAMNLVVECYKLTTAFPKSELYGLASQLRRAAVSVPANIAEGQARQHVKEFVQHLSIAQGSLAEAETHVQIAERLHYINDDQVQNRNTVKKEDPLDMKLVFDPAVWEEWKETASL